MKIYAQSLLLQFTKRVKQELWIIQYVYIHIKSLFFIHSFFQKLWIVFFSMPNALFDYKTSEKFMTNWV
jgi:hypothetical protein